MLLTIYLALAFGHFFGTWIMDARGIAEDWEHILGAIIWPVAIPYGIYLKLTYGR